MGNPSGDSHLRRAFSEGRAHCAALFIERNIHMLYTIAVVLLVLWLLGMVSSYTVGGFIHILLVIAIVMVLLRVISGRKVL
ncbi:MAG: family rane protein [Fibrobacteres bacterium]|nr:family rane protein [Fibrobacterota bacterium]